jgi:hypothetical protein
MCQCEAIRIVQANIEQHQAGFAFTKEVKRLDAIGGRNGFNFRQLGEAIANLGAIAGRWINHENGVFYSVEYHLISVSVRLLR